MWLQHTGMLDKSLKLCQGKVPVSLIKQYDKIHARMVVIPHTMAVCLIYSSMQAPGLFVPGLTACKEQGLFTFSPGRRKQAALTFMLHSRGAFWMEGCFTFTLHKLQSTAPERIFSLSLSLPLFQGTVTSFPFLLYCCISVSKAGVPF